jgi:hypothetical protein
MKKIILAAVSAAAMLAMSGTAEARLYHGKNTRYSVIDKGHQVVYHVENPPANFLEQIFGNGSEWSVTPQPRWRNVKQARTYYKQQDDTYFSSAASTFSSHSIVALGHQLQQQGFRVSEHPAFGGVHHVHAHHSAHYSGRALDVNVGAGVVEARSGYAHKFDMLAASMRASGYKVLWRVKGHFDHIHVQI